MMKVLMKGAQGQEVLELQNLLRDQGYPIEPDGIFGTRTYQAVKAFQCQNLDQHGQPLKVDGQVGPLTWRSLTNPKPVIEPPSAIRYDQMPPEEAGGSYLGRAGLVAAIDELKAGACEIGGNNQGPWVRKYLEPVGLEEGNSWCSSFVSWCFFRACDNDLNKMSFPYSPGARDLMGKFKKKAWAYEPQSGYGPLPGDVVFWWRVSLSGWQGHVGLIHQLLVLFKKPFCILFQNLRQNLRICAPDVLERKVTHNQNHNGNPDHEKF